MTEDLDATLDGTFQEPRKKFWQRSSRKRTKSDAISVSSMDVSLDSTITKTRKRRRITELANNLLFSNTLGNALHKSFSKASNAAISVAEQENIADGTLNKSIKEIGEQRSNNLTIRSWITDVAESSGKSSPRSMLSRNQIKRQEAIYELYCGENILLGDLKALRDFYYEPLLPTGIFTKDELFVLFGDLDRLIQVHTKLRDDILELRDSAGFTDFIGPTLLEWLPNITEPYLDRCRTQVWARHLLQEKRSRSKRFQDFLRKRLELPRAVDLWTYVDVARSRVVKYPLLVNEIKRRTPSGHPDRMPLDRASEILADLLDKIDRTMGDAECELARSKIHVKSENDPTDCIKVARELITEGPLKDSRGLKLHCFLFDTCFALTRRTTRSRTLVYGLAFPVITRDDIEIDGSCEIPDHGFKIGNRTLTASGEHEKRHWMDAFEKAKRIAKLNDAKDPVTLNETDNNRVI